MKLCPHLTSEFELLRTCQLMMLILGRDSIQLYALLSHPVDILQTAIRDMLRGKRVYMTRKSLMSSSEESPFHATTSEIKDQ